MLLPLLPRFGHSGKPVPVGTQGGVSAPSAASGSHDHPSSRAHQISHQPALIAHLCAVGYPKHEVLAIRTASIVALAWCAVGRPLMRLLGQPAEIEDIGRDLQDDV